MKLILLHLKKNKKLIILLKLFPNTISKKKKTFFQTQGTFWKTEVKVGKTEVNFTTTIKQTSSKWTKTQIKPQ